jgi:myo-inositol-1(or 4)-monophosphatase
MDTKFVNSMEAIAREAGALLLEKFKQRIGFTYKGDVDLVTEADKAAEKLITERIRHQFPGHGLFGEEGARHNLDSDYRWYIDPLDGTTNFAHGFPVFCVSLGLEYKKELVAGVVFDPTRNEVFAAEKGSGAFLNGERIYVSKVNNLSESLSGTGFPSHKRHKNPNILFYHVITLRSHGVRRAGSAALDLANIASGRLDGFWEFNLNPWDTAAGVVLVREAGGMVTYMDGSAWKIESQQTLATNGLIHRQMLDVMRDIFEGKEMPELPNAVEYLKDKG